MAEMMHATEEVQAGAQAASPSPSPAPSPEVRSERRWLQLVDERIMLGSIAAGSAAYFAGITIGMLVYVILFVAVSLREPRQLTMFVNLAFFSLLTMLVASQYDWSVLETVGLYLLAPIAALYVIRFVAEMRLIGYAAAVLVRWMKLERIGGSSWVWVLAGIVAGYAAVQLCYEAKSTVWGALAIIAVTLFVTDHAKRSAIFLYTGTAVYGLLTTLFLWQGIRVVGEDPILFLHSYVPDLLMPAALAAGYRALIRVRAEEESTAE